MDFDKRLLQGFCLENELCVSNTWIKSEAQRKVTFILCEIDFVLIGKEHQPFF